MSVAIGIDLGTTNTVVGVVAGGVASTLQDEHGRRLLPSVVSFHPQGNVLVGDLARERRTVDARNTIYSVKRLIGRPYSSPEVQNTRNQVSFELNQGPKDSTMVVARGTTYAVPEISAFVLRRAKAIAEAALGVAVTKAVITVPANFNELQRASTKVAGRLAGLDILRILNEPTAAALAYGQLLKDAKRVVVYDFGGGTFDVTVLDLSGPVFEVLSTAGDMVLGGDDIDAKIGDLLAEQCLRQTGYDVREDTLSFARLRVVAEEVKRELSNNASARQKIGDIGFGNHGKAIEFQAEITRAQLEGLARPFVQRTLDVTQRSLEAIGCKIGEIDDVLLVGGSTRMPLVAQMVAAYFGKKPTLRVNPDEVVALGAAIQANALHKPKIQVEIRNVTVAARTRGNPQLAADIDAIEPKMPTAGELRGGGTSNPKAPTMASLPVVGVADLPARSAEVGARPTIQRRKPDAAAPGADAPIPAAAKSATNPAIEKRNQTDPGLQAVRPETVQDAPERATPPSFEGTRARSTDASSNQEPALFELSKSSAGWSQSGLPPAPATAPLMPPIPRPRFDSRAEPVNDRPAPPLVENMQNARMSPESRAPMLTAQGFGSPPPLSRLAPPMAVAIPTPVPAAKPLQSAAVMPTVSRDYSLVSGDISFPDIPLLELDTGPLVGTSAAATRSSGTQPLLAIALNREPALPASAPLQFDGQLNTRQADAGDDEMRAIPTRARAALLVDVTPLSLRVETVGGYSDALIVRNTPVPSERTRVFLTAQDAQTRVTVRVAQGENPMFRDNTFLGELELTGITAARRGEVQIAVTFALDADGTLQVRAKEAKTNTETRATMRLLGANTDEADVAAMMARQQSRQVVG